MRHVARTKMFSKAHYFSIKLDSHVFSRNLRYMPYGTRYLEVILVHNIIIIWSIEAFMQTNLMWMIPNIHNWPLQPFSHDYDLSAHTTYVVCVNFKNEWRDLQFIVDSWEAFQCNFIFCQIFCQNSAERKSPKKYFIIFVSTSDLGF